MINNNTNKPLASFILLTYNHEEYVKDAIKGALNQTYDHMEIILSDDCSTDNTFNIMQKLVDDYSGDHKIILRKNNKNIGLAAHISSLVEISNGEIIIIAAGDDISLPDRTKISVNYFENNPDVSSVLLSAEVIDIFGNTLRERSFNFSNGLNAYQTLNDLLAWNHFTFGATRAFRKNIFDYFGPLNSKCPTEDTTILLRSLLLGKNILSKCKVVKYRKHDTNLSSATSLKSMKIEEIYNQYSADISKAAYLKFISGSEKKKLQKWIILDRKIRNYRLKLKLKEALKFNEMLDAIFHPATMYGEKLRFFLEYFKSIKFF